MLCKGVVYMANIQLQCHCGILVNSIATFFHGINRCSCKPSHDNYKKEQQYLKKLEKQLNKVIHLLNNPP